MKVHSELSTIMQLNLNMYLKKIFLIMITLDLNRGYKDIGMYIIELFEKVYIRYN